MATKLPLAPWGIRDALAVYILPWVVLPIVSIVALSIVAADVPALNAYLNALDNNDPRAALGLVALDALGSLAIIAYYLRKYKTNLGALGLRSFQPLRALLLILLVLFLFFVGIGIIYTLVTALFPHFNPDQPQVNEFTQSINIYGLLALVIIPPFVEEPVFRGFLFPAFSKHGGPVVGAILSSLLFGFAHLQANVSVYTFMLGLILCWLYARLGSIIPGMALHMLNNYIAYTALIQK